MRDILIKLNPKTKNIKYKKNVAIYGAGEAGNQLLVSLKLDRRFKVVYFFDDSEILQNRFINGIAIKNPKYISNYVKNFDQLLMEFFQYSLLILNLFD